MSSKFTEVEGIRFRKILRSHQIDLEVENQMADRILSEEEKKRFLEIIRKAKERAIADAGGPEAYRRLIEKIADELEAEGVFDDLDKK